ncbi:RHS repeat-associated core domain-containing protein [Streptomyces sp. TLI_171]|uniref:RHS repeat-associated core domain-containing protein n=1 Tax=Streptomyces sp. TLI_171 TaxID=1938859 RepID=UPI000C17D140|nr:RHS repeat-associated core domain-containing protein [Streptomyces sp. TLI_171]RKE18249.1 RHS repeat-associated protein [Streptomyces sp. TLI_171]
MSNQIVRALEHGAQKLGKTLAEDAGKALKSFYRKAGDNLKKVAHNTREIEAKHAKDLKRILEGHDSKVPHPRRGRGPGRAGSSHPKGRGRDQVKSPRTEGRPLDTRCEGGEPVDIATGRMFIDQTDAALPGSLPLEFTRNFESGLLTGRWMGLKWICPFDERLEIDADGVVHVRPDRITQAYPRPEAGDPVHPVAGSRHELAFAEGLFIVTDPSTGLVRTFTPTPDGDEALLTEVRDRHGRHYTLAHDEDGVPLSITHSGGYRLLVTVDNDRITALRLANGGDNGGDALLARYSYTDGHLTAVYNSSGKPMRFTNDSAGRLTSWTDRNASRYRYTYDAHDRVIDEGGTTGALAFRFGYSDPDPVTGLRTHTETNALGHTTSYRINDHAQVVAVTDPLGHTTAYERDDHDRLLAETDALGRTTRYHHDGAGDLIAITRPDGEQVTAGYTDHLGLPTRVTEPGGATWRQTYDENGLRTSLTDPLGATTRYTYDEHGHLATTTDALGHTTRIRCNPAGLPVEITDPLGATTTHRYDAFGRRTATTDQLGHTTRTTWTTEGHPVSRTTHDGATESWTYDGEGNCLSHTDQLGQTTAFEYTHFETLAARTDPDGARYTFTHDSHLQLVAVTNAIGEQWTYRHDPAGRIVGERDFAGRTVDYQLDEAGQLLAHTDPLGVRTAYGYDVLGRTVSVDAGGSLTTFDYDLAGNLLRARNRDAELVRTVDALGLLLTESVNGLTVIHQRDVLGRRVRRTTPAGHVSAWSYDPLDRPLSVTTPVGGLTFRYDAAGRETSRCIDERLTVTSAWSPLHRLTEQTVRSTREVLQERSYSYRADGHLTEVVDRFGGRRTFELSPVGRVTAATAADWSERYRYDAVGNPTEADWPAGGPTKSAVGQRSYRGSGLVGAGRVRYEHDAAGRTTLRQVTRLSRKPDSWHYTWDAEGRLAGITTPDGTRWRYLYDPLGRRIAKQRLDGDRVAEHTDFSWDGAVLAEQTAHAPYLPGPHTLSWDHHGLHPLAQAETITHQGDVDRRFFAIVTDLVGTPVELLDSATEALAWRSVPTVWGLTTWPSDSTTYCPLRFPGQYFDPETRLHYNVHRYYDPETGRYASPDPLGLAPAANPDTYVGNPHTWTDPLGLSPHRHRPRIETGNDKEGWVHIDGRHVTGNHPHGPGDLMPPGTTREQVQSAAEKVVKRGQRISDPAKRMQLYERRLTVNGMSARYRVLVDSHDFNRVITFFPVEKSYRP